MILTDMSRSAEDLKLWQLMYRSPIRQWARGRVILIGDAAHPMLPRKLSLFFEWRPHCSRRIDQGQGANQAIEDAGALGIFLANVSSRDEVPRRLESIQNIRRDRAGAMQIFSNAGQDESHRIEKEVQQYIKGPVPSAFLLNEPPKQRSPTDMCDQRTRRSSMIGTSPITSWRSAKRRRRNYSRGQYIANPNMKLLPKTSHLTEC